LGGAQPTVLPSKVQKRNRKEKASLLVATFSEVCEGQGGPLKGEKSLANIGRGGEEGKKKKMETPKRTGLTKKKPESWRGRGD